MTDKSKDQDEQSQMMKMQVEVMGEKTEWVQKKIPNYASICDGPTYQIAILIGNPDKTFMELRYDVAFDREEHKTMSRDEAKRSIDKFVHGAFDNDAKWSIKTFAKLEDAGLPEF